MIIKANDEKIRFSPRWRVTENYSVCTANGGICEFNFSGDMAILEFDVEMCRTPYPHIYISVDRGARIEVPIDKYIRISAKEGEHYVEIITKSSTEVHQRWFEPLESKVALVGIEADGFTALEEDSRKTIEFIGDSITEGVLIDEPYQKYHTGLDRVFEDDSTATYAWLTAEALGLRPIIMGYGAVGVTKGGCGSVPKVYNAYPYFSHENPCESANADYIVINHGTNDSSAPKDTVRSEYDAFLKLVRERNPKSKIICLTPFGGYHADVIFEVVSAHNQSTGDKVYYIDSTGWVPKDPVHPLRDGHKTIAKHLAEILKKEVL